MLQVCLIHGDGFGCARVYAVRGEGREEETSRRSWQGWWSSRGETDNGPPEEPHSCLRTTSSPVARPRSRALWPGQRARPSGFAGRLLPSCESLHALQRTPPGAVRLGKGGGATGRLRRGCPVWNSRRPGVLSGAASSCLWGVRIARRMPCCPSLWHGAASAPASEPDDSSSPVQASSCPDFPGQLSLALYTVPGHVHADSPRICPISGSPSWAESQSLEKSRAHANTQSPSSRMQNTEGFRP